MGHCLGCLLSGFLTALCAAYLLRVPLLTGVGVIALYYFSFFNPARRILNNGFDLDTFWDLVYVYLSALLLALVIMVTGRVVQLHGIKRFFGADVMPDDPYARWLDRLYYILLPILVVVVVIGAVVGATYASEGLGWPSALGAGAVGLLLFLPVVFIVHVVQILFTRKKVLDGAPSDVLLPTEEGLQRVRDADPAGRLSRWSPIAWLGERLQRLARLLFPENVGRGYFEYRPDGSITWIRRGHLMALFLCALTLGLYLWFGESDFRRLTSGLSPLVPTLCYVLLLATLLCWGLSFAAFFLDRYRIPVFVLLVAIVWATSFAPWLRSDHYYPVRTPVAESDDTTESSSDDRIIVVAATGGGIQSAAWTARVLTGLEEECRDKGCSQSFDKSIRVISAASGGSVGTMYFVNEYKDGVLPDEGLEKIVDRAERSSLDYIVWGLLYPDLVRLINITPFDPEWLAWDRGRALQLAWLRKDMDWDNRQGVQERLSRWRNDAMAGDRPAVIFNTTISETGQRLPLTTTVPLGRSKPYAKILEDGITKTDISVVTAARLSATFPYASPAARANVEGLAPHLVDGGYYDNYGVVSLVEWLDEELERNHDIDQVLVVEIRGAGGPCTTDEDQGTEQIKRKRGWFFQAFAPLRTVLNVRGPAQLQNNEAALDLLVQKWDEKGEETEKEDQQEDEEGEHRVEISRAVFQFDGTNAPTQWHLTPEQKRDIQKYWEAETTEDCNVDKGWDKVAAFLGAEAGPGESNKADEAAQVPKEIVTPGFVQAAYESHRRVDMWTVNEEDNMHRSLVYGLDGIMTDRPDVLNRVLEGEDRVR